eukprot:6775096-Ditylum_brightwellii.AAC.1
MIVPGIHDLSATQTAIVLYASSCKSHMSPQNVLQLPKATATNEHVPIHRWNTSPHMLDTHAIINLADGIEFSKPVLPASICDNSNKDAFSYHNNSLSYDIHLHDSSH